MPCIYKHFYFIIFIYLEIHLGNIMVNLSIYDFLKLFTFLHIFSH